LEKKFVLHYRVKRRKTREFGTGGKRKKGVEGGGKKEKSLVSSKNGYRSFFKRKV